MNFDEPRIFDWGTRGRGFKSRQADCIFSELVSMFPQMFPHCGLNELWITNPVKKQIWILSLDELRTMRQERTSKSVELDSGRILICSECDPRSLWEI